MHLYIYPTKYSSWYIQNKLIRHTSTTVSSTVLALEDEVRVYDSIYHTLDRPTKNIISNQFDSSKLHTIVPTQKQTSGQDCGLFATAISTTLACYKDLSSLKFIQPAMRQYLVECMENGSLSPFSTA